MGYGTPYAYTRALAFKLLPGPTTYRLVLRHGLAAPTATDLSDLAGAVRATPSQAVIAAHSLTSAFLRLAMRSSVSLELSFHGQVIPVKLTGFELARKHTHRIRTCS